MSNLHYTTGEEVGRTIGEHISFSERDFLRRAKLDATVTEHVNQAIERVPHLQKDRGEIEMFLHNEIVGREAYLAANVVNGKYFQIAPPEEQTALLREPQHFIEQNGHISPEDKLKLLRERPWDIFPLGYTVNIADWSGTHALDARITEFMAQQSDQTNVRTFARDEGERKLGFGAESGKYLYVVRRRDLGWFGDERHGQAPATEADAAVAVRKRSVFMLDTEQAQDLAVTLAAYQLLESRLQKHFDDVNTTGMKDAAHIFGGKAAQLFCNLAESDNQRTQEEMEALKQTHAELKRSIETHINERSSALIPLSTSYYLRQRQMPLEFVLTMEERARAAERQAWRREVHRERQHAAMLLGDRGIRRVLV